MIVIKCDACGMELRDLEEVYNVLFTHRKLPAESVKVEDAYGTNGALMASHNRQVCLRCWNALLSEIDYSG